jgi:hypothetical protein
MQVGSGWQSCENRSMPIDKDDADALRNAVRLPNDNFMKRSFAKKIHNSLIYFAVPRGVEPPTFGLGSRFPYRFINDLQPDVANVLHPFPRHEIPQHIFARADDLPARCPHLSDIVAKVFLHWGSKILRAAGAAFV